jgi:HK97 family phage portal protein
LPRLTFKFTFPYETFSLMQWLKNTFNAVGKMFRSRWSQRRALSSFLTQGTGPGAMATIWTDSRYEQVRAFKHWVYIAIDRIATEVAMHQPNVSLIHEQVDGSARPGGKGQHRLLLPEMMRRKALTPLLHHQQLEPVRDDHPLVQLLSDPNEPDSSYDLWYETVLFLLLTGSAYWWMPRNQLGLPGAVWVVPSHWMWANIDKNGFLSSYQIRPVEGNYLRLEVPASDVIHFKKKSPISKLDGYAPLTAGSQWIDCQSSIDRSRWFSFRNGAFPGVALEMDERLQWPDDETLNRIEAKFMARYTGEIQTQRPMFIPPGFKFHKLNITPAEMDFSESAEQMRDQILALFGVPSVVAGISKDMTYGSVIASRAGFYYSVINPLFRFLGQHSTKKLAHIFDSSLRIWWEDRTPQDPETVEQAIRTDFACGAISPNEVRRIRGREPYPFGGDDPLVQGAMMTLPFGTGKEIVSVHDNMNGNKPQATSPLNSNDDNSSEEADDE